MAERENDPVRIRIAGCATGEEAYSVAILRAQALGGLENLRKDRVQIFATDIDRNALGIARRGRYPLTTGDDIPSHLAEKYTTANGEFLAVRSQLKDVILFSEHNVCQDPPFLNTDLVCCRNLLIYFNIPLQAKVLARFSFSLVSDGYLFLGTAESVTVSDDLYRALSPGAHIFRQRIGSRHNDPVNRRQLDKLRMRTPRQTEPKDEDMQSAIEELQASNEELQASNEDLETANEELQSTNEELVAVNEELQITTVQMNLSADEQQAVLASLSSTLLIMDAALQISNANDAAIKLFSLRRPVDLPHISQCSLPTGFPPLAEICNNAIRLGRTQIRDAVNGDKLYTLECTPFFDQEGHIVGATMIVVASAAASRLTTEMRMLHGEAPFYLFRWSRDGTIISISEAYARTLGTASKAAIGSHVCDVFNMDDGNQIMRTGEALLRGDNSAATLRLTITPPGQDDAMILEVAQVARPAEASDEVDTVYAVAVDVTDLTVKQQAQADLIRELEETLSSGNVFRHCGHRTGYQRPCVEAHRHEPGRRDRRAAHKPVAQKRRHPVRFTVPDVPEWP